jgi:hypothetical protein
MTYPICGKCLHAVSSHEPHNAKFMYCAICFKLCELEEFKEIHKPTELSKIMEISAKKQ